MPKPYLEWVDDNRQTQQLEIIDKVFIGRSCKGVDPQKRILVQDAQEKIAVIPTVSDVRVELVFDPPWNQGMMSDEARLQTGLM